MTFRQINRNIIKEYFKTRSIIDVAGKTEISVDLIKGILFTRGVVDKDGIDLGLNEEKPIDDVFCYEGPEAVTIRVELDFGKLISKDKQILEKYGNAKDGRIYRDFIIPPKFTLHQLNYVIQQAFGWQNCHSHNFSMKNSDFTKITKGMFKNWCDLCGIYFRYPDSDHEDLYWDDDFEEGMDYEEYFASKYIGPYEYRALGDYFLENQLKVKSFNDNNRMLPIIHPSSFYDYQENKNLNNKITEKSISTIKPLESTLDDLQVAGMIFEGKFESLIESLEVLNVLIAKGKKKPDYMLFKNELINNVIKNGKETFDDEMEKFGVVRNNLFDVLKARREVEKAISEGQFDVVTSWNERMDNASVAYQKIIDNSQPPVMPVTDEITYEYDSGDGWEVKIKSLESYYDDSIYYKNSLGKETTNKIVIHDEKGNEVSESLAKKIIDVINFRKPKCIESSGIKLLDDVGGPSGFINMLRELNEPSNKEDAENMRVWAYDLMKWSSEEIDSDTLL